MSDKLTEVLYFTEQDITRKTMLAEAEFQDGKLKVLRYGEEEYYAIGLGTNYLGLQCREGDSLERFLKVCDVMGNIVYKLTEEIKPHE